MKIEINGKTNLIAHIISSLIEYLFVSLFVWFLFQVKPTTFTFIPEIGYKDAMWLTLIVEVLVRGFKAKSGCQTSK